MPEIRLARSFLTGSRVYGKPRPNSDLDLVVFVSEADQIKLVELSDNYDELCAKGPEYKEEDAISCRYGKLNLLLCTKEEAYQQWKEITRNLKELKPVNRVFACAYAAKFRELGKAPSDAWVAREWAECEALLKKGKQEVKRDSYGIREDDIPF